MTDEEKGLILMDISHRLVYGVKIKIHYKQNGKYGIDVLDVSMDFIEKIVNDLRNGVITEIKEFLRPISSMTDKEFKMLSEILLRTANTTSLLGASPQALDYLYSIGIDVSNLLKKGLAIEEK